MTYRARSVPGDPFDDVAVGGEVGVVDGDHPSVGYEVQGGVDLLEDPDRGRLVHGDLAGRCTEQRGQLVTDCQRQVQPVVFPPRADQIAGPVFDHPVQRFHCALRCAAQRVPVEVDQLGIGDHEFVSPACQGVGGVQLLRIGSVDHPPTLAPATSPNRNLCVSQSPAGDSAHVSGRVIAPTRNVRGSCRPRRPDAQVSEWGTWVGGGMGEGAVSSRGARSSHGGRGRRW